MRHQVRSNVRRTPYPIADLIAALGITGGRWQTDRAGGTYWQSEAAAFAQISGLDWSNVRRTLDGGMLTHLCADRYAVACGFHPGEIWPDFFDYAELREAS